MPTDAESGLRGAPCCDAVWGVRLEEIVPVLQLSIGPVIVISGVGLLMLSMTNRYGRVIDRARTVADAVRKGNEDATRQADLRDQLGVLLRRARLLRWSILLAAVSLLFAALLIITLFVAGFAKEIGGGIVVALFVVCMATLIASIVTFIQDLNISLAALDLEVRSTADRR